MNLLAMDTSGPSAGVAVLIDGALRYEAALQHKKTHSQNIMPLCEAALDTLSLKPNELDYLACVVGPGSFTGVRIGISSIKGLAQATGAPCIGVNALEALSRNFPFFNGLACPILDARAGQVYTAIFEQGKRVTPDLAIPLYELLEKIQTLNQSNQKTVFLGDALSVYRDRITQTMGDTALMAPLHLASIKPSAVAALALEHLPDAISYDQLEALYLRAPQAERERAAKEAASRAN